MPSWKLLLGCMLLCLSVGKANAMSVEDYNKIKDVEPGSMLIYLNGIGSGYFWSNTYLMVYRKAQPLYCQPGKLVLHGDNYKSILDAELQRSYRPKTAADKATSSVDMFLLLGLINTFPCEA